MVVVQIPKPPRQVPSCVAARAGMACGYDHVVGELEVALEHSKIAKSAFVVVASH